jgi:Collagen triple helix repeat (20 copies)
MRRRTLILLAIPAAIAAMTVAVPALAGVLDPSAHSSASKCFIARIAKHRVRECLVQGPRGLRGLPGPAGPRGLTGKAGKNGTNGKNGANGTNGSPGAPGTARGYAVVQPNTPSAATLITPHNITSVSETSVSGSSAGGVYCVTPAAPINAAEETVSVSPEVSYSAGKLPGIVAVNAQRTNGCPATSFEVDTYAPNGTTPTSNYAFTIIVP